MTAQVIARALSDLQLERATLSAKLFIGLVYDTDFLSILFTNGIQIVDFTGRILQKFRGRDKMSFVEFYETVFLTSNRASRLAAPQPVLSFCEDFQVGQVQLPAEGPPTESSKTRASSSPDVKASPDELPQQSQDLDSKVRTLDFRSGQKVAGPIRLTRRDRQHSSVDLCQRFRCSSWSASSGSELRDSHGELDNLSPARPAAARDSPPERLLSPQRLKAPPSKLRPSQALLSARGSPLRARSRPTGCGQRASPARWARTMDRVANEQVEHSSLPSQTLTKTLLAKLNGAEDQDTQGSTTTQDGDLSESSRAIVSSSDVSERRLMDKAARPGSDLESLPSLTSPALIGRGLQHSLSSSSLTSSLCSATTVRSAILRWPSSQLQAHLGIHALAHSGRIGGGSSCEHVIAVQPLNKNIIAQYAPGLPTNRKLPSNPIVRKTAEATLPPTGDRDTQGWDWISV